MKCKKIPFIEVPCKEKITIRNFPIHEDIKDAYYLRDENKYVMEFNNGKIKKYDKDKLDKDVFFILVSRGLVDETPKKLTELFKNEVHVYDVIEAIQEAIKEDL